MRCIDVCAAFLIAGPALAHDFWIEPKTFRPPIGAPFSVRLRVGQDFAGDPVPRQESKTERFVAVGGDGEKPIVGLDGRDPAGAVRLERAGLYVLGYRSKCSSVELEPEKFALYLEQEGLEQIGVQRRDLGEAMLPAKEIYSRCAKSIVVTEAASDVSGFDRVLGFTLELIPDVNPCTVKRDEELPVRLVFEGKPLAGALVVALNARQPLQKVAARSDHDGRAVLKLFAHGQWLIKAVHMVRAQDQQVAQWESFWASLTFENSAEPPH
ncbi:MAG: DUF4198 domain-containing protein [Planctomycetota bacterium]